MCFFPQRLLTCILLGGISLTCGAVRGFGHSREHSESNKAIVFVLQ